MSFTSLDYSIIIFFIFVFLQACWRGLLQEAIACVTWILALVIACCGGAFLADKLIFFFTDPVVRFRVSCLFLLGMTLLIGFILRYLVKIITTQTEITLLSRVLAGLLGLLRAYVIASLLLMLGQHYANLENTESWKNAVLVPYFSSLSQATKETIDTAELKYTTGLPPASVEQIIKTK